MNPETQDGFLLKNGNYHMMDYGRLMREYRLEIAFTKPEHLKQAEKTALENIKITRCNAHL
jgi:hypothetical protein